MTILPLLLSIQSPALAGAWTLPAGDAQVIVTTAYSFSAAAFDSDGEKVAVEKFEKFELQAFGEYGVTDWATVVVQPQFRSKEQGGTKTTGLGRVDFGLRTRFWHDDYSVASVEGGISAPGQSDELAPLNGGDTDWEMEARLLYGRGFTLGWRHGFFDAQTGYRYRFSDPADEVVVDLTVGLDVTDRSFAMLQSFNRLSVGSAKGVFEETQEHKLAFSSVYRLNDRWSFQAGSQVTAYGRNVLAESGFFVALWSKL